MDINNRKDPKVSEAEYRQRIREKLTEHQQLMNEVNQLKERVAKLEAKVAHLETINEELANRLVDMEKSQQ